jgi:hypothetical protein
MFNGSVALERITVSEGPAVFAKRFTCSQLALMMIKNVKIAFIALVLKF